MNKFNIGDRIFADYGCIIGNGTLIGTKGDGNGCDYLIQFDNGNSMYHDGLSWKLTSGKRGKMGYCYYLHAEYLRRITDTHKIIITHNNHTTLARLYEGERVIKSAEAKCAPNDSFNFNAGARLAFDRLVEEKKPIEKTQDKPAYRVGGSVRIIAKNGIQNSHDIGDVGLVTKLEDGDVGVKVGNYFQWVSPCDIEQYVAKPQDKPEPVKLYCISDNKGWLTKGKVYEFNGSMNYDNAYRHMYASFGEWKDCNPSLYECLVPLVSRPAKVGEYILITDPFIAMGEYKKNDILCVEESYPNERYCVPHVRVKVSSCLRNVNDTEYLVIDGYKPEPKYYSGKVVCVWAKPEDGWFTSGKTYEFKNGLVHCNFGVIYNNGNPAKTKNDALERHSVRFIKFKG